MDAATRAWRSELNDIRLQDAQHECMQKPEILRFTHMFSNVA
jgi:hypothetical protein